MPKNLQRLTPLELSVFKGVCQVAFGLGTLHDVLDVDFATSLRVYISEIAAIQAEQAEAGERTIKADEPETRAKQM